MKLDKKKVLKIQVIQVFRKKDENEEYGSLHLKIL